MRKRWGNKVPMMLIRMMIVVITTMLRMRMVMMMMRRLRGDQGVRQRRGNKVPEEPPGI